MTLAMQVRTMRITKYELLNSLIFIFVTVAPIAPLSAHHYKGLPHYNYFENYPQVPTEEFLGQAGEYELSLMIYDFQGLKRSTVEQPDNVFLFLIIFDLEANRVYNGAVSIEIINGKELLYRVDLERPEEENIYRLNRNLTGSGEFVMRVVLKDEQNRVALIPFHLSSQKIAWGKWLGGALAILVLVAAFGSRRARIQRDRRQEQLRTTRQASS